jgi:endoglucanase Acf2
MSDKDIQIELGEASPLLRQTPTGRRANANANAAPEAAPEKKYPRSGVIGVLGVLAVSVAYLLLSQAAAGQPTLPEALPVVKSSAPVDHSRMSNHQQSSQQSVRLFAPFSTLDPRHLAFSGVTRPDATPGHAFGSLTKKNLPLPTNSWSQNLMYGAKLNGPDNKIDQIPYIVDTNGPTPGLRTHGTVVQANDRMVMTIFEASDGMALGAVEKVDALQTIVPFPAFGRLALTLNWNKIEDPAADGAETYARMRTPIVRGCPYTTMEYTNLAPLIVVQRKLSAPLIVDNKVGLDALSIVCGEGKGNYSAGKPFMVNREIKLQFDTSDMTWLLFVSQPTEFVCTNTAMPLPDPNAPPLPPGVAPTYPDGIVPSAWFQLRATAPMQPAGVVRIALTNNCTTGQSPIHCDQVGKPRDQSDYEQLIREHAELYPSGAANIEFGFPTVGKELEQTILHFNWRPLSMTSGNRARGATDANTPNGNVGKKKNGTKTHDAVSRKLHSETKHTHEETHEETEEEVFSGQVLMLALPHQQSSLISINESTNTFLDVGCVTSLHGKACPVAGNVWNLVEEIRDVHFGSQSPYKPEMLQDLRTALLADLTYEIPVNYQKGAGDTYFSGKMLSKLARIVQVGSEVAALAKKDKDDMTSSAKTRAAVSAWLEEYDQLHEAALDRLRSSVEVWLNGSALAPLVFDDSWGGIVGCGCEFDSDTNGCSNEFPNCPALTDPGQNFGSAFYNDHHFHYGYHIYAAAILTKFDHAWGRKFHEHVLCLIRDIANPSESDPFFPMWRHKDWFMGSSWASGIVTIMGNPYPNGRNQESSSEAINAYEGIALYGLASYDAFHAAGKEDVAENCKHIHNMGKLLLSTEIRSAQVYYHVQNANSSSNVKRIYPDVYTPKVVGMLWSFLAQEQTWFGNQPWASYGIQLMPITPSAQYRDSVGWVEEMLPNFNQTCAQDPVCRAQGWSILVMACQATVGRWREAWAELQGLEDSIFETAGGNGHSRTNSLWWIATRPYVKVEGRD